MTPRRTRLAPPDVTGELADSLARLRRSLDLPDGFPPEVIAEAEAVIAAGIAVDGSDADRADLGDVEFLTIDPEGSHDLDQAVSIVACGDGFLVSYAIADLAAFIRPGGAIDAEAWRRGQTLYAPDGSVPLHPESLSHGAASLLPDADRRAYVWRLTLDGTGRRRETDAPVLLRAWVRSRRQWSYAEAQAAIDDGTAPETLRLLAEVGPLLIAQEAERDGASLNAPEEEVVRTADGYELHERAVPPIEEWNAQVSLLAGMTAAAIMLERGRGILRIMPPAEPDAIAEFRRKAALLGRPWEPGVSYGAYLRLLDPDDPVTAAVVQAAASLFRGAGYAAFLTPDEIPEHPTQAAIGAPYAHTTAPLRRLVDRYVLAACEGDADADALPRLAEVMRASGSLAGRLESGAIDRVEAAVLAGRIGEVFDAVVLSSGKETARVQIADPFVTGTAAAPLDPGATVRVRVDATDVGGGTIALTVV